MNVSGAPKVPRIPEALSALEASSRSHMEVTLDDVLVTARLAERPPRPPNYRGENEALQAVAREIGVSPQGALDVLVREALALCAPDRDATAGVSLYEPSADGGDGVFRWIAMAGRLAAHVGGTTPRHFSPCGVCLDQDRPVLFHRPDTHFTYFLETGVPFVEGLIVPFRTRIGGAGTIWVVSHDEARGFDAEDARIMTSLADFTATTHDMLRAREVAEDTTHKYEELLAAREAAWQRTERLQALASALSVARTSEDVGDAFLHEGIVSLQAEFAVFVRLATEPAGEGELELVGSVGIPERHRGTWHGMTVDHPLPVAEAIRSRKMVWAESRDALAARFPALAEVADEIGADTWIALPLVTGDRVIGAFGLGLRHARLHLPDDAAMLVAMAHLCAQAMDRARLLEAERAARVEAERERADLTAVLEVVPIGIGIARDRDCREIRVNPAFAGQLGITPDVNASKTGPEAKSLPFAVFHDGQEVAPDELPMQRAAREATSLADLLYEIRHADGRRVQLLEYAAPLFDEHGEVRGSVGAFIDVTERVRLLEEERAARARVEQLQEVAEAAQRAAECAAARAAQLAAAASAFNAAPTVRDVTAVLLRESRRAVGADAGAVLVLHEESGEVEIVDDIGYDREIRDRLLESYRRFPLSLPLPANEAICTGVPVFYGSEEERRARFPESPSAGFQSGLSIPLNAGGRRIGALSLAFAAPRELRAEEQTLLEQLGLQWAQALDRAQLYESEHRARAEAEEARHLADEASRAKSDFLAVMSHELRTPLNAIAGYTELLEMGLRGPVTAEQQADLGRIKKAQRTLLVRINDVLNFSRLEGGHVEFDLADVSIADLLAGIEPLVAPQMKAKNLIYECLPGEAGLHVRADAEKASQALLNLVANAIKFTPSGGRVSLAAEPEGQARVVIAVRDTGVGIPPDKLPRIFDPFVQVDTRLQREHEGSGLGLAISRDLLRGMGGELTVESEAGVGSTFRLHLPRVRG